MYFRKKLEWTASASTASGSALSSASTMSSWNALSRLVSTAAPPCAAIIAVSASTVVWPIAMETGGAAAADSFGAPPGGMFAVCHGTPVTIPHISDQDAVQAWSAPFRDVPAQCLQAAAKSHVSSTPPAGHRGARRTSRTPDSSRYLDPAACPSSGSMSENTLLQAGW